MILPERQLKYLHYCEIGKCEYETGKELKPLNAVGISSRKKSVYH